MKATNKKLVISKKKYQNFFGIIFSTSLDYLGWNFMGFICASIKWIQDVELNEKNVNLCVLDRRPIQK